MRWVGVVLVTSGVALAGWGVKAAFESPRRRAVAGALAAPVGVLVALLGVVLVCVPGFLSAG